MRSAASLGVARKSSKEPASEIFFAHSLILKARAPELAALAESSDESTPIPIENTDPDIFRQLLRFVYGGLLPSASALREQHQSFIDVADRFGSTELKLAAEAKLVKSGVTTDSCADMILYAVAKNCALLKEMAVDFFTDNGAAVMESEGFGRLSQSTEIMKELMAASVRGNKRPGAYIEGNDYKRMRVGTLRKKLEDQYLDMDGSREMLIARLETADKERDEKESEGGEEEREDIGEGGEV